MGINKNIKRLVLPALKPIVSPSGKIIDTYTKYFKETEIQPNTFLFESRDGQSMTDSPLAIFEYLLATDTERKNTYVWSIVSSPELDIVLKKYRSETNIIFVERESDDYLKWLCQAQYLINNATFQQYVIIKEEQTYINTWHGTPLKTMGYDIPGNPADAKNVVRNFFMSTFLLSPNAHTTNMYLDSYRLRGGYEGHVLEAGYPRIDQTFRTNHDDLLKTLFEFKRDIDLSKKIMLYTPTWKGASVNSARNDLEQIYQELASIRQEFGDTYNVLVKVHPFLYEQAAAFKKIVPYLIPDCIDTNKLLGIVDLLITDYSSIFFDFLVTDRPILFYCWDDDLYTSDRGKYFEYDELPGPVAFTIDELKKNIADLDEVTAASRSNYERFKKMFVPYDDGQTTKRYVEYILYGKMPEAQQMTVINGHSGKIKLLIYPGGMRNNGITSSAINLIQNIDTRKYDVTCFLDQSGTMEQQTNIGLLPKSTHLIFRFGNPNFTTKEGYQDLRIQARGYKNDASYPDEIYERECLRLLGNQHFDVAIDFSGYSLYWSKLILASQSKMRICYMHSDMLSDMNRVVNGRKIHKVNLRGLFSLYHRFDYLMSVSDITRQTNADNLAKYAAAEKFVYTPNTINPDRILGKLKPTTDKVINKTVLLPREGIITIDSSVPLRGYNARPDFYYAKKRTIDLIGPNVAVLGEFEMGEQTYYKISQNGCYLGWVRQDVINILPDHITDTEKVAYFGKLATTNRSQLFDGPISLDETVPLGNARYMRNLYVTVPEIISTQTNCYVPVIVGRKKYGYVPLSSIRLSYRFNQTADGHVSFGKKIGRKLLTGLDHLQHREIFKQLKEQPTKRIDFKGYYQNTLATDILCSKVPNPTAEKISIGVRELVYVHSLNTNSFGNWYLIEMEVGNFVWVEQEQLMLSNLEETRIYSNEKTFYYVDILLPEVNVYASEKDILTNNYQLVKALPLVKVVRELVTTDDQTFIQVEWQDKLVWLNQEDTENSLAYGMFNNNKDYIPYPNNAETNFVTMGRLSPEKNQVQLVEAFAAYYQEKQSGYLYLIGSGPEQEKLEAAVDKYQLNNRVIFVGQMSNPFEFMRRCDIFVLTSLYEGQPMVLLEAMTLGMSIISTDIPACRHVLEDGRYGCLTKTNDAIGVKEAMIAVADKQYEFEAFDPYGYNQKAIEHFYRYIDTDSEEEDKHE
ncbi:CDP-glycerol glycerophosphotransferase family protein [Vagococcus vulneris]|uniref:CDP-glycerol glycerophosphotransferase family protein n=1 Tax=Vagococcus vulneris TaxID=1977869 RepID=UPI00140417AB|nr:CDP-glycerol glycerophosphotransferase family protein [Vagococcus vulneris]